jgi:hypothetical protein
VREILVCVTFREFDGSANARIQERFLDGLAEQSYGNFRVICTNYREQHVKEALDAKGLAHEFHQSEKDCLCSWTEVIQNSFQHLEAGQHIILWTNADNVFQPNLFSEIIKNFEGGSGGTSYPHIPYAGLEGLDGGRPTNTRARRPLRSFWQLDPNYWVPDTIYIDGDLMLDAGNRALFRDHEFRERWPGMAQTLVLAFFAERLKNLFFKSRIATVENVLAETATVKELVGEEGVAEDKAKEVWYGHFKEEDRRGYETLMRFCEAKGTEKRFARGPQRKLRQHAHYDVVGRPDQRLLFSAYLKYWSLYHRWSRRRSSRSLKK